MLSVEPVVQGGGRIWKGERLDMDMVSGEAQPQPNPRGALEHKLQGLSCLETRQQSLRNPQAPHPLPGNPTHLAEDQQGSGWDTNSICYRASPTPEKCHLLLVDHNDSL